MITDICRSNSPSGHKDCASADVRASGLPDKRAALNWLSTFPVVCEVHRNQDIYGADYGSVKDPSGDIDSPNVHFHCTDKYWLDQQNAPKKPAVIQAIGAIDQVRVTSYNPVPWQTDDTPCIAGGTGINVCEMAKRGERPVAVSQELAAWSDLGKVRKAKDCGQACKTFEPGEKIVLASTDHPNDWRCNGEFVVSDAMNVRYRKRVDLFFLDPNDNISCNAKIIHA